MHITICFPCRSRSIFLKHTKIPNKKAIATLFNVITAAIGGLADFGAGDAAGDVAAVLAEDAAVCDLAGDGAGAVGAGEQHIEAAAWRGGEVLKAIDARQRVGRRLGWAVPVERRDAVGALAGVRVQRLDVLVPRLAGGGPVERLLLVVGVELRGHMARF